jgi:hypothetical protein
MGTDNGGLLWLVNRLFVGEGEFDSAKLARR